MRDKEKASKFEIVSELMYRYPGQHKETPSVWMRSLEDKGNEGDMWHMPEE